MVVAPFLFPFYFPAFKVNGIRLFVVAHLAKHFLKMDVGLAIIRVNPGITASPK